VQLAVIAHIRHCYTDYDRLLKIVPYRDARMKVEADIIAVVKQWRAEDKDQEMEEALREIIVIDDDDDDEEPVDHGVQESTGSEEERGDVDYVDLVARTPPALGAERRSSVCVGEYPYGHALAYLSFPKQYSYTPRPLPVREVVSTNSVVYRVSSNISKCKRRHL
jgi:hypothetical protein